MLFDALFNWLDANGFPHDSGNGQMQFLIYENIWIPQTFVQSQYNTMTDFLNSTSTSLHDLVLEWMYHWEGINDGTDTVRLNAAQRYYNLFLNDDGTRNNWYKGNYYLTPTESDNNALLIKDFLFGTSPTPTPTQPTDEELIALIMQARKLKQKGVDVKLVL